MSNLFYKDPQATLWFNVFWADWLYNEGVELSSYTWEVPEPLVLETEAVQDAETEKVAPGTLIPNGRALVRLSGGEDGKLYSVVCHIAAGDEQEEKTMYIKVGNR